MKAEAEGLRDIHLPEAISAWPLASGYWLLLVLVLLFLCALWVWRRWFGPTFQQRRQQQTQRRRLLCAAAAELRDLAEAYQRDADSHALSVALSAWLRRVALQVYPQEEVAALTGLAWLQYLDRVLAPELGFVQGPGQALLSGPYAATAVEMDTNALLDLCERWLAALPETLTSTAPVIHQ